ncbi:hypothetical protein QBC37DRAFT_71940 [Rhypophila decipiens]|uniref:Uncharacterized protein n=1 Tax=Rhypophila decipiens TaxID=261697 RepID=A0AAN6YI99_9PEZI|nr:hypothetical protein QBC37DRAFT_71940 [Rhypophila decipiens]
MSGTAVNATGGFALSDCEPQQQVGSNRSKEDLPRVNKTEGPLFGLSMRAAFLTCTCTSMSVGGSFVLVPAYMRICVSFFLYHVEYSTNGILGPSGFAYLVVKLVNNDRRNSSYLLNCGSWEG